MELKPGTLLQDGEYRIIQMLGHGGFGITYLAESRKGYICIKEFFPSNYYFRQEDSQEAKVISERFGQNMRKYRSKFRKEALNIARFNVDNIVKIHDVFDENNTSYYVMDYIDGESLYDIVIKTGRPLSEERALRYIRQAGEALKHIHNNNTVHLDIKPNNIMIRRSDDKAMVIDFGLSKHIDDEGRASSTTPGGYSVGYTPLEMYQSKTERVFLPNSDIYSLGATLYVLVTGQEPPEATEIPLNGVPTMPDSISDATRHAITMAMQPNPTTRPQNIDEFFALLTPAHNATEAQEVKEVKQQISIAEEQKNPSNQDCKANQQARTPEIDKLKRGGAYTIIKTAIDEHFNEIVRRGVIIKENKRHKIITEIFINNKRVFKISSSASHIGRCRFYAATPEITEALSRHILPKYNLKPNKDYDWGNAPDAIVGFLTDLIAHISGVDTSTITYNSYKRLRNGFSIMIPLLFAAPIIAAIAACVESYSFVDDIRWGSYSYINGDNYVWLIILCAVIGTVITLCIKRYNTLHTLLKFTAIIILTISTAITYNGLTEDKLREMRIEAQHQAKELVKAGRSNGYIESTIRDDINAQLSAYRPHDMIMFTLFVVSLYAILDTLCRYINNRKIAYWLLPLLAILPGIIAILCCLGDITPRVEDIDYYHYNHSSRIYIDTGASYIIIFCQCVGLLAYQFIGSYIDLFSRRANNLKA